MDNPIGPTSKRLGIAISEKATTISGRLSGKALRAFMTISTLSGAKAKHSRIVEQSFGIAAGLLPSEASLMDLILSREDLAVEMLSLAQAQQQEQGLSLPGQSPDFEILEFKTITIDKLAFDQDCLHFHGSSVLVYQDDSGTVGEADVRYDATLTIDRLLTVKFLSQPEQPKPDPAIETDEDDAGGEDTEAADDEATPSADDSEDGNEGDCADGTSEPSPDPS